MLCPLQQWWQQQAETPYSKKKECFSVVSHCFNEGSVMTAKDKSVINVQGAAVEWSPSSKIHGGVLWFCPCPWCCNVKTVTESQVQLLSAQNPILERQALVGEENCFLQEASNLGRPHTDVQRQIGQILLSRALG